MVLELYIKKIAFKTQLNYLFYNRYINVQNS